LVVIVKGAVRTDRGIGPPVKHQQLAPPTLEWPQVRILRAENFGHGLEPRKIAIEPEGPPGERWVVVFDSEKPEVLFCQCVSAWQIRRECQRAILLALGGRCPDDPRPPPGGATFMADRESIGVGFAIRGLGSVINLSDDVQLPGSQTIGGIGSR